MTATYFITGATGVIGSALCSELLKMPDTRLKLLLRPGSMPDAGAVEKLLAPHGMPPSADRARVQLLAGDICAPRLGLCADDYESIVRESTHLLHCAGNVKSNLPAVEATSIAVGSACRMVELAQAGFERGRLEKLDVLSTLGVAGRHAGSFHEERVSAEAAFHNSYESAKAAAEALLYRAADEGLPITIHRPSMVVGDSRDGAIRRFQVFYYIAEFLAGVQTWGIVPALRRATLDLVPVDLVARAIAWTSREQSTQGKILHLCSGARDRLDLMRLTERVQRHFRARGVSRWPAFKVPQSFFRLATPLARALTRGAKRRSLSTLDFFFDYLRTGTRFENEQTRRLLAPAGIEAPTSDAYLAPVLDYYLERRRRPWA